MRSCRRSSAIADVPRCGRNFGSHFASGTLSSGVGMPSYRFKFYDPNSRSEKRGAAVLASDNEAAQFAHRVIRELIPRRRKAIHHVDGGNHRERPQSRDLFVCTGSKGSRVK